MAFWGLAEMVKGEGGNPRDRLGRVGRREAPGRDRRTSSKSRTSCAGSRRTCVRLWGSPTRRTWEGTGQAEAFAAWRRFFEALAERGPLVLVFEDLHWADDGLLDFVDYLVDWAVEVPLLVVCTARPELRRAASRLGRREGERAHDLALGAHG